MLSSFEKENEKKYQLNLWQHGDRRRYLAKHNNAAIIEIVEKVIDTKIDSFFEQNEEIKEVRFLQA